MNRAAAVAVWLLTATVLTTTITGVGHAAFKYEGAGWVVVCIMFAIAHRRRSRRPPRELGRHACPPPRCRGAHRAPRRAQHPAGAMYFW